ncbi:hypothetical protein AUR64_14760 [Haloprofundus marisrubri]|uniref:Pyrrolo-quinoline quinone repeat domain-containing protein n=1 Tax=Haloprofundus marisrubri TaxID=1514971 RepID=A0A0W1R7S1_9EURY|nr:PQQ-binding-like beta-propeller repeat protein [Haloprofundus marisrubri]KTG09060.1 hypothetical protein AUR64_14760 [Haloprofundus marisrubri]
MVSRRSFLRNGAVAGLVGLSGCTTLSPSSVDTLWRYQIGRAIGSAPFQIRPTVLETAIVVNDFHTVAVLETDGAERWSHEYEPTVVDEDTRSYDNYLVTGVGADGKRVYVPEAEGLTAFALDDGERLWRSDVRPPDGVSLVASNSTVFGAGAAFEPDTGAKRWDTERLVEGPGPLVSDDTVVFGDFQGRLHAVDIARGEHRWYFDTDDDWIQCRPATDGERIYFGSGTTDLEGGCCYAVTTDGDQQWMRSLDAAVHSALSMADGRLYVATHRGTVYALDPEDGTELWKFPGQHTFNSLFGRRSLTSMLADFSPTVADDELYVVDPNGTLSVLDTATGERRTRYEAPSNGYRTAPVVDGDRLYLRTPTDLIAIERP